MQVDVVAPPTMKKPGQNYNGPDVTPFIHTLMCVKQKNLYRTTLTSYFGIIHMSVCMKGVTPGPLYKIAKLVPYDRVLFILNITIYHDFSE